MAEIILRLGAEGGSLRLVHHEGRGFAVERDASGSYALLDDEDLDGLPPMVTRSEWGSWREALDFLDRYPWHRMVPLFVHPGFVQRVLRALKKRGVTDAREYLAVAREGAALQWRTQLSAFVARCRARKPIPARETLSLAEEHQCRIIGGALIDWLQDHGPAFIQARNAHARVMPLTFKTVGPSPTIVLVLDRPGLVAANEILESKPPNIFLLTQQQYHRFTKKHPDDTFDLHILHKSRFVAGPTQLDAFPLRKGEEFWLHEERTILGRHFGRGGSHLWSWNGHEPTLAQEGFGTWIS